MIIINRPDFKLSFQLIFNYLLDTNIDEHWDEKKNWIIQEKNDLVNKKTNKQNQTNFGKTRDQILIHESASILLNLLLLLFFLVVGLI